MVVIYRQDAYIIPERHKKSLDKFFSFKTGLSLELYTIILLLGMEFKLRLTVEELKELSYKNGGKGYESN